MPTDRVDSALQRWRGETVRRRNIWATDHASYVCNQRARREQVRVFAAASSFAFLTTLGGAFWAWSQWSEVQVTRVEATPYLLTSEIVVSPPASMAGPVRLATKPGLATPVARTVPRLPPVTAASLGVQGEIVAWEQEGALWAQVDFLGESRELRWFDAAGAQALEPTPCTNLLSGGLKRCFVGRSAERVQTALDAGHAPGTWTAKLCDGERCATVAKYAVSLR